MKQMTYSEAIREAMSEEMRRDSRVIFLGEDIGIYGGAFGVSVGMVAEFGEDRVMDTPISEAGIAGVATGAAMTGLRPIMEIMFMDFTTIAMDAIVNQAAKIRYMFGGKGSVPMVLRCPAGSGAGAAAQHSQSLEAWFCHVPGLKVVTPSTPAEAKGLLKAAIRDDNPVIFIEQKLLYRKTGDVPMDPDFIIPLGKADIKKAGSDVSIITYGRMVWSAMEASEILEEHGISMEVVDLRSLVPIDRVAVLDSVRKTGRVIVLNEAVKTGGFAGEISAMIAESDAFDYLDGPIVRLAGSDTPIPYNPELEKAVIPSVNEIVSAAIKLMNRPEVA